ncbi:histone-lysine N-methyltransferase ASHH3 isoform X2 [Populus alba x Populus x berolinensis]|nr:histone-lysine N-methyltransferase ASHH3 isoform X2 [Populus alba x Populus x berolinensis]
MGLNSIQPMPMPMPMPMVHGIRFLTSQENLTFNCYNTGGCTLYYYTQQEKKSKRKENSNKNKICSLDFSRYSVLYILYSEQLCYLKPCLLRRSFSSPNTVCCTTAAIFSSDLDQRITLAFNKLLKDIGNQVEFELPDSFNKSKSTAYTLIKRNIYLTKKIKRRLEDDGIFCSCSASPGSSRVCDRDCHCGMLLSSCSSGCKCGSSCSNKPFQQRQVKKMKLVQTEKCGSGIVADEDIKQGEFVIEYVGEVIDDKTCEERLWKMKHCGETNFYLCEINRDMVIDATYKGNKSRYINHSCSPNTEMQKWIIDGETRIGIFATRDIRKGEHLTYDYQYECLHPLLFHSLIMVESSNAYTVSSLRKTCLFFAQFFKIYTQSSLINLAGLFNLAQIKIAIVVPQVAGKS